MQADSTSKKSNVIKDNRGFTLLELIVVAGITMVLITMGLFATRNVRNRAMLAVLQGDVRMVKEAALRFKHDVGIFPPDVARGVDPGLASKTGWQSGSHSAVWDSLDLSTWNGPYMKEWKRSPWGGIYDWDNFPAHYSSMGIPGGGAYLSLKPSDWGGADGMPKETFEEMLENMGVDQSAQRGVIAVYLGSNEGEGDS